MNAHDEKAKKLEEVHEQLQAAIKQKKDQEQAAQDKDDKEDGDQEDPAYSNRAALLFGLVTLSATALSYQMLNKNK